MLANLVFILGTWSAPQYLAYSGFSVLKKLLSLCYYAVVVPLRLAKKIFFISRSRNHNEGFVNLTRMLHHVSCDRFKHRYSTNVERHRDINIVCHKS